MTDTTSNEAAQNLTSARADDDRRVDPELVALARRAATPNGLGGDTELLRKFSGVHATFYSC